MVKLTSLAGFTMIAALATSLASVEHAVAEPAPVPSPIDHPAQGNAAFKAHCAVCHGDNLEGGDHAPPLAGPVFMENWGGKPQRQLYSRIISTMPLDDPGSLSSADALAITLAVLDHNGIRSKASSADDLNALTIVKP